MTGWGLVAALLAAGTPNDNALQPAGAPNDNALRPVSLSASSAGATLPPPRIVVLGCKRPVELGSLLGSLLAVGLAGGYSEHTVPLDVMIDMPRGENNHSQEVLTLVQGFRWPYGPFKVVRQSQHMGILGQWLDLKPKDANDWFVVLEDDLAVSPCFYKYLVAARDAYGNRTDVAGVTLQTPGGCYLTSSAACKESALLAGRSYLRRVVGSWGFMPHPGRWTNFLDWTSTRGGGPISGLPRSLKPTVWYDELVKVGKADSMWTIWHIAYTRAANLATVSSVFSKPLSEPHGKQESEHGNSGDRPALLLLDTTKQSEDAPVKPDVSAKAAATAQDSEASSVLLASAPSSSGAGPVIARAGDLLADCGEVVSCFSSATSLTLVDYDGGVTSWPLVKDRF